jgi:hypothetical protein
LFTQEGQSRRDAFAQIAAAGAALVVPAAANAAAGEAPRFSVFGLFGDGSAYSEGAAYGTDQEDALYSPYSVYGEAGPDSLYKDDAPQYVARKRAVLAETKIRLNKLPAYIAKRKWFEVTNELTRYMYETRGAVDYLTENIYQKEAGLEFEQSLDAIWVAAKYKKQEECAAAVPVALAKLEAFEAKL